ncbi:DNA polymerase-3 subunit alpha [Mycoplasmoides fastidiosum]|uniref:DNA-directed DNA polymerase n=1 Tax=Mycoplasmoides fastidiosum TaxID=92758 RepID=A0ABU0LZU0_9BACT|nr:DNA polymerase III subunit alpha [Mycoplasmoides fastidiosum]MDQ0514199.1 DNA polymerase-3 subunit alpha [Mycoplasmoides fastidiosum]UUD37391.1 DNA polymerase III subunit alpha [Mycoplasmoides fastidiosum]
MKNHQYLPQIYNQTVYTLLQATLKIDDLIAHAKKHNHKTVVITDFKHMFGYVEFYKKAIANNLKPVFGLSLIYKQQAELVLLAKNKNGFNNLVKISSFITTQPTDTQTSAAEAHLDRTLFEDLIVIVYQGIFDLDLSDVYYFETNDPAKAIYLRKNLFQEEADYEIFCALNAIKDNKQLTDVIADNNHFRSNYLNQPDPVELTDPGVKNLFWILEQCTDYDLSNETEIIDFPTVNGVDPNDKLRSLAKLGLQKLVETQKINVKLLKQYSDRLIYELNVISKMNFANYFLIVQDYITWAKRNGIFVGPGRGSVAGSLVAYVIGITMVDPLVYDLYFERFLNPARANMPDIDIDFMDSRREEVINYIYEKYSADHVAQIVIFQTIKARSVIRDVGRILGIELSIVDKIAKNIPTVHNENLELAIQENPQLAKFEQTYPQLFAIARKIIGIPRQVGIHPAGLVLSKQKLGQVFPVTKNNANLIITQFSMDYLEDMGLLKMDLLGLRNLTLISEVFKLIYQHQNKTISTEDIKLNDPLVFSHLATGDTTGIFQLESAGMTDLTRKFKPRNIEDISLISALYRPGPQKHIPYYLKCRFNEMKPNSLHDSLKDIIDPTYGVIVYQEQLIAVVVRVTNLSLAAADIFRRAVSKKEREKFASLYNDFVAKGLENNYSEADLVKIWDCICEFANYSFNHSHSISYAIISYWLVWLRTYYPLEFYCVLLSTTGNLAVYINKIRALGFVVNQPSINYSEADFTIHQNQIYFGLGTIKGLGKEAIKKLLKVRQFRKNKKYTDLTECLLILYKNGIKNNLLKIMNHAGCFDELFSFEQLNRLYVDELIEKMSKPAFVLMLENNLLEPPIFPEWTPELTEQYRKYQTELLGFDFSVVRSSNPLKAQLGLETTVQTIPQQTAGLTDYLVTIETIRETKTKFNHPMLWVKVSDETGTSRDYPYFGKNLALFMELHKSKQPCVVVFESNRGQIRIKDIKIINEQQQ